MRRRDPLSGDFSDLIEKITKITDRGNSSFEFLVMRVHERSEGQQVVDREVISAVFRNHGEEPCTNRKVSPHLTTAKTEIVKSIAREFVTTLARLWAWLAKLLGTQLWIN